MLSRLYPINIFVLIGALCAVAALGVAVFLQNPETKTWTMKLGLSPSFIDATFVDAETGWAVGTFGTVMKTEDRGETWRMQTTGTSAPIRSVHFLDRNTGWAVGAQGVALFTKDGGETWELTEAPPLDPKLAAGKQTAEDPDDDFVERANLLAVRFDDPSNGWAVSSLSVVYRSTDGGATWLPASDKSGEWIAGVHLVEGGAGLGVSSFGTLRSTADRGATWEAQTAGTSQFLVAADFLDKQRGWVVGRKGTVLKTEDAGESWTVLDSGSESFLLNVDFIDENNGWAVGRGGAILRTADGGLTWISQLSGVSASLLAVHFEDEMTGWALGSRETILGTQNGGDTWELIWYGSGVTDLADAHFVDMQDGWMVGPEGAIFHTPDGARTMFRQVSGTSHDLNGVYFEDNVYRLGRGRFGYDIEDARRWAAVAAAVVGRVGDAPRGDVLRHSDGMGPRRERNDRDHLEWGHHLGRAGYGHRPRAAGRRLRERPDRLGGGRGWHDTGHGGRRGLMDPSAGPDDLGPGGGGFRGR